MIMIIYGFRKNTWILDTFSIISFCASGEEEIDGKHAEKWTLTVVEGEKKNVYTMWVGKHHHGHPVPIKYVNDSILNNVTNYFLNNVFN